MGANSHQRYVRAITRNRPHAHADEIHAVRRNSSLLVDRCIQLSLRLSQERFNQVETTVSAIIERIEYQEMIDATIARYKSQQIVNSIVNRIEKNKKVRASYFYM